MIQKEMKLLAQSHTILVSNMAKIQDISFFSLMADYIFQNGYRSHY